MENLCLEKQGRILIPKNIREKLKWRSGERIGIEVEDNKIVLTPLKNLDLIKSQLKGCVNNSKINPLEIKKIWVM